jgi:uncharacterized protein YukE
MAVTSLTQAEAQAKISQVDQAMQSAHACVKNMQDETQQMTSSSWLGNQSQLFLQKMQQTTDDMRNLVNRLQQIADTGKHNMTALVNLESQ